jgi:hypothetical protein
VPINLRITVACVASVVLGAAIVPTGLLDSPLLGPATIAPPVIAAVLLWRSWTFALHMVACGITSLIACLVIGFLLSAPVFYVLIVWAGMMVFTLFLAIPCGMLSNAMRKLTPAGPPTRAMRRRG